MLKWCTLGPTTRPIEGDRERKYPEGRKWRTTQKTPNEEAEKVVEGGGDGGVGGLKKKKRGAARRVVLNWRKEEKGV